MKIVKGVFTYLLILVGIVFIASILMFTAMAFFKFPVFGTYVVMSSKTTEYICPNSNSALDSTSIVNVTVNSGNYGVIIRSWTDTQKNQKVPRILVREEGFGLSTNGVREAAVEVIRSGNNITITVKAPTGVIAYKDSHVEIALPISTEGGYKYNLTINSGKGDVSVVPTTDDVTKEEQRGRVNIYDLSITTTSGDVSVRGLGTGEHPSHKFNSLSLKTETGKFDFSNQDLSTETGSVKIESRRGDFTFKNYTGSFVIEGDNLVFNAESIVTENKTFLYNCPNGTLDINKLDVGTSFAQIVTEYARVEIDELLGDTAIQATYGDIIIKNTTSNVVDVTTTHGDISIGTVSNTGVNGTIALRSTYGDITVDSYPAKGWFTNKSGRITITHAQNNEHNFETKIETKKGHVVANNMYGKVTATATGEANMDITFANIPSSDITSNITIGSGKLNINVPVAQSNITNNCKVNFTFNGGSADVYSGSSNMGNYTENNTYGSGDYTFNVNVNGGKVKFTQVIN